MDSCPRGEAPQLPLDIPQRLGYPAVSRGARLCVQGRGVKGEGLLVPPLGSLPLCSPGPREGQRGHKVPSEGRAVAGATSSLRRRAPAPPGPLCRAPLLRSPSRHDAEALTGRWLWTGPPGGPAAQHAGAQVLGDSSPRAPALPALARGRVLQPRHVAQDQAHGHRPLMSCPGPGASQAF